MKVKSEVFPAVVFGFPDVDNVAVGDEGIGLPFYVRPDRVSNCATNPRKCPWACQPTHDEVITLPGIRSAEFPAGSFGGFLTDNDGALHGLTARHCVPGMGRATLPRPPSILGSYGTIAIN